MFHLLRAAWWQPTSGDTLGAQSAGFSAALITRRGNAALPVAGLPQPNFFAPDLPALAAKLPAPKAV
jgi:2-haloacid dehalogenase